MSLHATIADDIDALKAMIAERDATIASRDETVEALRTQLSARTVEIEHLKLTIAKLRRQTYGRKSEKLDRQIEQLELRLEELVADEDISDAKPQANLSWRPLKYNGRHHPQQQHMRLDGTGLTLTVHRRQWLFCFIEKERA